MFGASGAVLVLEILAVRMLAPYVGLTIETYTTIIGVVLGGIALGSSFGGRLADVVDPRRLLAPLLVFGGLLAMATVPLVHGLGRGLGDADGGTLLIALIAFLPPAVVLSVVTPATVKLQLADLDQTGSVVGRLSAWATAGALVGTFAAGFLLVPLFSTRTSVLAIGAALVVAGVALGFRLPGRRAGLMVLAAGAAGLGGVGMAAGSPCDAETTYYCATVVEDDERPDGRLLILDDLRHSYVDLEDPRHLEFPYVRWIGAALEMSSPAGSALDAVFVGGGGFTLPRHLPAVRPGSRSTVLELDGRLVDFVREHLGLRPSPDIDIRIGDARTGMRALPDDSADFVVGDAFGGRAVPWHLATAEFAEEVRRVLRPGGTYALNVIDRGPMELGRAEAATLRAAFPHVALVAADDQGTPSGGNLVFLASDRPLRLRALAEAIAASDGELPARVFDEREVARFAGRADPLVDQRAPADQLLSPPP